MGKLKKNAKETGRSDLIDKLQEENKTLKSQIRHLEREIKKSKQPKGNTKEYQDSLIEEDYKTTNYCIKCGKGNILITSLGPKNIITCSLCDHREIVKHGKKEKSEEI